MKAISMAHHAELHKRIGVALWACQVLESALVPYIALILKFPPSRAEAEVRKVLENLETKTLGQLIVELRKGNTTNSVAELESRMNKFLAERNWLVHNSWREHGTDLFTPERLPPLIHRLALIEQEALALQKFFGDLVVAWTLQLGFTEAEIEAETQRRLRDSGVSD